MARRGSLLTCSYQTPQAVAVLIIPNFLFRRTGVLPQRDVETGRTKQVEIIASKYDLSCWDVVGHRWKNSDDKIGVRILRRSRNVGSRGGAFSCLLLKESPSKVEFVRLSVNLTVWGTLCFGP